MKPKSLEPTDKGVNLGKPQEVEEYTQCEKCGGETGDRLIEDETFNKCGDCKWITH